MYIHKDIRLVGFDQTWSISRGDPTGARKRLTAPRVVRALELDAEFKELNLGLVDGTVAALAERRQVCRVLTTDRRVFSAIRISLRLSRALDLLPQQTRSTPSAWL